jgi:hypothetical protein
MCQAGRYGMDNGQCPTQPKMKKKAIINFISHIIDQYEHAFSIFSSKYNKIDSSMLLVLQEPVVSSVIASLS